MGSTEKWEAWLPANNYVTGKNKPVASVSRIHSARNKGLQISLLGTEHIRKCEPAFSPLLLPRGERSSAPRRHTLISEQCRHFQEPGSNLYGKVRQEIYCSHQYY